MATKKAIWWFYPSLLEPCDGPWGRLIDFGHDPVACWKAIIDWAAALKIDRLIPGIEPYSSDRVYNQWGFHYVCRFPDDPDARCFDDDAIDRNVQVVRSIAAYGLERGVDIMFHHYNLMAPERWVLAHPRLAEKYAAIDDPVWGRRFRNDRLGNLVSNVCWNEPDYQAFLKRCWRETFANIPELAGTMITAGEFNYCGCEACTGGTAAHIFQNQDASKDSEEVKKIRDRKRGEMCVDLIQSFVDVMEELKKTPLVRTWVMSGWMDRLPKGVDYVAKYSAFDACWGGPDPVIHEWLDGGHAMWESVAIEAENCGPVIWHDQSWCEVTAERNNALDLSGCLIHINTQWGHTGHIGSFTASRNVTRLLEGLEPATAKGNSEREFIDFFGPEAGPDACRAARLIATFPLHMTSVVHLAREGFSYGMPPWFDGAARWPGVLGTARYQPEPWSNPDGLIGVYELIQAVAADPKKRRNIIHSPENSAISRCDEIAAWCAEAVDILVNCPAPARSAARSELKALHAAANIAEQAAREHAAVLRARVAWEVVKSESVMADEAAAARAEAVEWYEKGVEALRRQIPWGLEMAKVYPDLISHIVESHETFNRLTMATRLRIRREELRRIQTVEGPDWESRMTVDFWSHLPNSIGSGARPSS